MLSFAVLLGCGTKATRVGAPVTVKDPVSIASLSSHPENYVGQTVRLEGTVKSVCQGTGCWVEVQDAQGTSFVARSLDHEILLPMDCTGKKVVVQGVVTAMSAGEACSEHTDHAPAADHVCPRPDYVVATTGAMVR
jgi:hypothetical protein